MPDRLPACVRFLTIIGMSRHGSGHNKQVQGIPGGDE
jgi:hypothetical protein